MLQQAEDAGQHYAVPAAAVTGEEREGLMRPTIKSSQPPRRRHAVFFGSLFLAAVAGLGLLLLGVHTRRQPDAPHPAEIEPSALIIPADPPPRFVWEAGAPEEDVSAKEPPQRRARLRLRVEGDGPAFRFFEEFSPRPHRCLRGKSLVFVGDSITRCVFLGASFGLDRSSMIEPHPSHNSPQVHLPEPRQLP